MTDRSGNRVLRLCAGLAASWAVLQGGAFFAHAQADPAAHEPAGTPSGTPSNALPEADSLPVPARLGGAPDTAFAAYQRGYYVTAMREAMKRIDADPGDGPAMTLIGELYSQGLGVRRDTAEAARWYKLAAERSDRQAIFALGNAKLKGEGVPRDRAGAAALFEQLRPPVPRPRDQHGRPAAASVRRLRGGPQGEHRAVRGLPAGVSLRHAAPRRVRAWAGALRGTGRRRGKRSRDDALSARPLSAHAVTAPMLPSR